MTWWRRFICALGSWTGVIMVAVCAFCTSTASALPKASEVATQSPRARSREHAHVEGSRDDVFMELGLRFAFASPVGALGLEAHVHLQPWWTVIPGVGLGVDGPQGSLMTALHVKRPHSRIGIASGISVGRFSFSRSVFTRLFEGIGHSAPPPTITWSTAWWWNTEIFVDLGAGHTVVRPFVGVGYPIDGRASRCQDERAFDEDDDCDDDTLRRATLPTLILLGVSIIVW